MIRDAARAGAEPPLEIVTSRRLSRIDGVRHGFFTRRGGVSRSIFASLNCALLSEDKAEDVATNRRLVCEALGVQADRLCSPRQAHTRQALCITAPFSRERPTADALVTQVRRLALGTLAADCAPVLIADAAGTTVAAVHAGWRGALAGIIEASVTAMESLGTRRADLTACIGPAIQQSSYQVGLDLYQRFTRADDASARFFAPDGAEHFRFDLPGYVAHRLHEAGVVEVERLDEDTYSQENRFFSHRRSSERGEPAGGRQISVIALSA
jgi:YfiH family protein